MHSHVSKKLGSDHQPILILDRGVDLVEEGAGAEDVVMELVQPLEKGEFLYDPLPTFRANLVIQQGDDLLGVADAVNGADARR